MCPSAPQGSHGKGSPDLEGQGEGFPLGAQVCFMPRGAGSTTRMVNLSEYNAQNEGEGALTLGTSPSSHGAITGSGISGSLPEKYENETEMRWKNKQSRVITCRVLGCAVWNGREQGSPPETAKYEHMGHNIEGRDGAQVLKCAKNSKQIWTGGVWPCS